MNRLRLKYYKYGRNVIVYCPQMFLKIGVLKYFANFTRKQPCWNLSIIKM